MPIPDYQSVMLPLLKLANDGTDHSLHEAIESLAKKFELTTEEMKELLPSGRQAIFTNRVGWARTYLKKAKLLESPKRGYFQITDRGKVTISENVPNITVAYLKKFPEFVEFQTSKRKVSNEEMVNSNLQEFNPEEALELGYKQLRDALKSELLDQIKSCSPRFFENLVVDLLVKMGYGGSRLDAGQAIGKSGDDGIDGIIKEDRLGLDTIYIQAKRWWGNSVGSVDIRGFIGALQIKRAKKGVFITTSSFSKSAIESASNIECKIVLVDGGQLADLMIDNNIGVSSVASYDKKKIDTDYFDED